MQAIPTKEDLLERDSLLQEMSPESHLSNSAPYPSTDLHSSISIVRSDSSNLTPLIQVYSEVLLQLEEALQSETGRSFLGSSLSSDESFESKELADFTMEYISVQFPIFSNALPDLSEEQSLDRFINLVLEAINRGILTATEQIEESTVMDNEDLNEQIDLYHEYCSEGLESFIHSFGFTPETIDHDEFTSNLQAADEFMDDDLLDKLLT